METGIGGASKLGPESIRARPVVIAAIGLLSWHQLAPSNDWIVLGLFLVVPWAIRSGCLPAIHLSVLAALMGPVTHLGPLHPTHLLSKAALVIPYLIVAASIAPLRHSLGWLRRGSLGPRAWGLIVFIALVAAAADLGWVHFVNPDLSRYADRLPEMPGILVPIYAGAFAASNALIEEIIYRGVMMGALDAVLGAGWLALVLQALQFGISHFRGGFPNGWLGLALTASFGVYMGLVRRFTNGLLACWIAHTAGDFVIICLLIHFMRQSTPH